MLCFCVQLSDVSTVSPEDDIDPVYGKTLREALAAGVEIFAYGCQLGADEIVLDRKLNVKC